MKYEDTEASGCRYGSNAAILFDGLEIIWECSEADYQGSANVLGYDERSDIFIHYEWSYGSCSGCDTWEAQDLSDKEIENEMRREAAVLHGADAAKRYFKVDELKEEPDQVTYGSEFPRAGWALKKWLKERDV